MATYKAIRGVNIQHQAADPTATEGDVWYNATTSKVKMYAFAAGTWATGGNMNTAVDRGGDLGTQTAAMSFGGRDPGTTGIDTSETYNGTAWTETNDLVGTDKYANAGLGISTAGMSIGGADGSNNLLNESETYDGTNWTEGANLTTARRDFDGCGTTSAGLAVGGSAGPGTVGIVESWDASSCTEIADLNTARQSLVSFGTKKI